MRNICLIFIFLCLSVSVHAAWIENYPVKVTQPDGTVLNLFVTGDEYHNRVHDADGFTLLRNPEGWVVYATLRDGELVPTDIVYVQTNGMRRTKDAQDFGIDPNINISAEKWVQLREKFNAVPKKKDLSDRLKNAQTKSTTLRAGTMNNIVIYITFSDEPDFIKVHSDIESLYNGTATGQSLKSYFRDISNGQFLINSTFFPAQNGSATVISYQAPQKRSYYMIDNNDDAGCIIEHTLLRDAIEHCRSQIEAAFPAATLDYNNDGNVDNINFVIQGDPGGWSTLLWPHKWALYTHNVKLNGKMVWEYNLLLENHCQSSTLVHETYHTLGAPDLYMYSTSGTGISGITHPVGSWDVMCSNATPPQSSSAYITNKYGRFISDITEITSSGTYTLHDIWNREGDQIAYKIMSPTSTQGEYFVLEYRRKGGPLGGVYDARIPNAGIIISRINPRGYNTSATGTSAKPFEMYVYREGALDNITSGTIANAVFKQGGLTTFSNWSSPNAFLSDNSAGLDGIIINQFSAAGGETMTFNVIFPKEGSPVASAADNIGPMNFTANWSPSAKTQSYLLSVYYKKGDTKIYANGGFQDKNVGNVISFDVTNLDNAKTTWYYTVKAVSNNNPSGESNEIAVDLTDYKGIVCWDESELYAVTNSVYLHGGKNSYTYGTNTSNYKNFAAYYNLEEAQKITGFKIKICALQNNSNDPNYAKITMKLWNKGSNGLPNKVLYSEDFAFSQLKTGDNTLTFATPIIVPSEFFIGYEVYYSPNIMDIFGVRSSTITIEDNVTLINTASNPNFFSSSCTLALFPTACTLIIPQPSFTVETSQDAGIPVTFTNTSPEISNIAYFWDFGDGHTSTEKHPTHTYSDGGIYTVKLKIANQSGENTATKTIQVSEPPSLTLAKGRTWYISSPITAAKANTTLAAAGFVEYSDETRTTPYSASDPRINGWVNIAGSENTLVPGKGYVLYTEGTGNTRFPFAGIPNTGDVEIPLTRSTGVAKAGFNLVGNPYLSHIDWNAISAANAFLEPTIWYRTRTDAYHFYTYNSESGLSDPDDLGYSLRYIPAMQAFWVRALNSGTLRFTESTMVDESTAGSGNTLKATENGDKRPLVRLQLKDGKKADRTVIFADENAKDGFDRYDSGKMFNSGASIYTVAENEKLIFNGLSAIETGTEIPLGFITNHSGEYSIAAIAVEDFDGFDIMLKDNTQNEMFSLTSGEAYEFSSDITDNTSRFSIVFQAKKEVLDANDEVSIYDLDNTLYIQSRTPVKRVLVYNLAGKLLYNTTEDTIYNVASGIYVVKVETENCTVSRKIIVK
ncbi:M6 family metalloprotease domain-containing protein [Dysgonomonas sp. 511]|uniref:M6 family metalloprotease domain-containing protein n=1 Tax=Dysgonomonas sp. 511 TaxID=2302930 RepID=UPI0013D38AC0|nr:M6 family metalloprotease domain-containing protein [Dysgonomonas sp. 511]